MANEVFSTLNDYVLVVAERNKFPLNDFLKFIGGRDSSQLLQLCDCVAATMNCELLVVDRDFDFRSRLGRIIFESLGAHFGVPQASLASHRLIYNQIIAKKHM
jgi:hypothetical protein